MMASPVPQDRLASLANSVLRRSLGVKRGESVLIESWTNSLPYAEAFQLEARKIGAKPLVLFESEEGYWKALETGNPRELGKPGGAEWAALQSANAYVYFWGPARRDRWYGLPDKVSQALTAYNSRWYELTARKGVRACRMEIALAEPENAAMYGIDLGTWREELLAGSLVDPAEMSRTGRWLAGPLTRGRTVRLTHPNGTDLRLGLSKRRPVIDDGRVDRADVKGKNNVVSIPGGAAILAVNESTAEGTFVANRPSRYDRRRPALAGRWGFRGGKLTSFSYDEGGETFSSRFDRAPKGRDRPGLLEVGLNPRIHDAPNFEDQGLGAITLYIGSNAGYGGRTSIPFVSYLIQEGGSLEVDGRPLVRDGRVLLPP